MRKRFNLRKTPNDRRDLLKKTGAVSAAVALSQLPEKWAAPVIEAVILPAHGESSPADPPELPGAECGIEGTRKSDPELCCKDMNKTVPLYLDECCVRPALDSSGNLVTNANGEYLCCDLLDKNSSEYRSYCCEVAGKNDNGSTASDANGVPICCDQLDPDSDDYANFCCDDKAKNSDGSIRQNANGDAICCDGSNPDPTYCCIKKEIVYSSSVPRGGGLFRTAWTTDPAGNLDLVDMTRIPKWNPADGPLGRVEVEISGDIESHGWIESTDNSSSPVTFIAQAELRVSGPAGVGFSIHPAANQQADPDLGPGDNIDPNTNLPVPNRQGDDYWETDSLTASGVNSTVITDAAALTQFTGAGNLDIHVVAKGTSDFIGPSNVVNQISTSARAAITVKYYCLASA